MANPPAPPEPTPVLCPHCNGALFEHETTDSNSPKAGAQHCSTCGCCFVGDPLAPREGTPICTLGMTLAGMAKLQESGNTALLAGALAGASPTTTTGSTTTSTPSSATATTSP